MVNEKIKFKEVLVIGFNGEQLGVKTRNEALNLAYDSGMDLLCVAPKVQPPVCKILDYGKYRFEQQKKAKEAKKKQQIMETKSLRLSPVIDKHDFDTKLKQVQKWLVNGNKVKIDMRFKGRFVQNVDYGRKTLEDFIVNLNDISIIEKKPSLLGNSLSCTLIPKKKINMAAYERMMKTNKKDKNIYLQIIKNASKDISIEEIESNLDYVFDKLVLNYAKTLVINLPGSCNANCSYCIDRKLRKHTTSFFHFMKSIHQLIDQYIDFKEISLTGGNLPFYQFNELIKLLHDMYPNAVITWNTNGIGLPEHYNVKNIKYINLHRNAVDDEKNKKIFKTNKDIITIEKAKEIFGDKLNLRITIDSDFNLDEYINLGIPLYLNKLLPGNSDSNKKYIETIKKLNILNTDIRRRNHYINTLYKNIPVRICVGDKQATHVPGRYPVWLNVIIVHRSGVITGSWFEDDKLLYTPNYQ